ncbi:predicted protein [Naegleria gruberi]|uniref:Predicted protein n=1 Tax=Naegleria gruberi TaxID=5762 RepID=D2W355_NAEGR|nr:uncharacterized protein NAEGRDRAFT_75826 [Naegleria gruberi]EFC36556.1 predicted protein [Naegleria gruberi]|eukprot:XP_002669300.1 predicted protein [Naegleria gruberi strain NEG-M]
MITLPNDDTYHVNNILNIITNKENNIEKNDEIYYYITLIILKGKSQNRIKQLIEKSLIPLDNVGTLNGILMTCHRRQFITALWCFYNLRNRETRRDLLTLYLLTHNCRDFSDYFETSLLFQQLMSDESLFENQDSLQYEDIFSIEDLMNKYLELTILHATDKVIEVTDIMLSQGIPISSNNRYTVIHQARILSRQDIELKLGILEIK